MATLSEWMNRLRYLGRRSRFDDDLDVEVRFHIESRTAELIASGLSARDAVTRARVEFGSIARAVEDSRAAWQFRWIEDLAADLRYGFRILPTQPRICGHRHPLARPGHRGQRGDLQCSLYRPLEAPAGFQARGVGQDLDFVRQLRPDGCPAHCLRSPTPERGRF